VKALAASDVTCVLLPTAALTLGRPMPPGRALVDAGAAIALATDFNPGSSFCESLPLVMSLACTQMHLSPAEALAACTVNGAHVLGQDERLGRLRVGSPADVVVLEAPDWRHLAYHLGGVRIRHVIGDGHWALGGPPPAV
jgi:imidazolonepropionase